MGIVIHLYKNSDDKRVMSKTLSTPKTVTAELYDECDILSPKLRIAWAGDIYQYNYMQIPAFGRYYYIEIAAAPGGASVITAQVDPLMSHLANIRLLPAVVVRNSNKSFTGSKRSTWINDPQLPLSSGRKMRVVALEGSDLNIDTATTTSCNFVLNVAGGGIPPTKTKDGDIDA